MSPEPGGAGLPRDETDGYLGLPAHAAEQRARDRGWTTVRVVPPDAVITMEYRAGRLNLAVRDDRVVRCWQG
ncbi:I78 family peptidase inhibitor [Streptomyces aidingensis]|uniref:Peptidase inhibitor I78 family protein n=1 Tax=Streptomyces aidingensis TaxID=910347 RepID=A0A1I1U8U8_9ACTN|nr:I78 family peptidase inhibitor [Streptomyces aidingensis]SFD67262.1 Peptidase inhibitor I78 family protein [Streptomyces aidingensis]